MTAHESVLNVHEVQASRSVRLFPRQVVHVTERPVNLGVVCACWLEGFIYLSHVINLYCAECEVKRKRALVYTVQCHKIPSVLFLACVRE